MTDIRKELASLRDLAQHATEPGPGKWNANTELWAWFRSAAVNSPLCLPTETASAARSRCASLGSGIL